MQLFVGTSGYSYPKWKGSFYPKNLPSKEMLSYYAERFGAVEINSSFYRMPSASTLESWAKEVPRGFQFTFKAPQAITHFKRLKDAAEPTKTFFRETAALKSRRGPLLFGLHPNHKKDISRLRDFLQHLDRKAQVAFEFRHPSWLDDEVIDCLKAKRCALCVADDNEIPLAPLVNTAGWGYVRLRRAAYTARQLREWIEKLRSQNWSKAYVFFKHEDTGTGPKLAARFLELAIQ
jgi:uncharacterized protein YecE (DUF72 family)